MRFPLAERLSIKLKPKGHCMHLLFAAALFFLQKRKNLVYYKKKEKIVIYQKGCSW